MRTLFLFCFFCHSQACLLVYQRPSSHPNSIFHSEQKKKEKEKQRGKYLPLQTTKARYREVDHPFISSIPEWFHRMSKQSGGLCSDVENPGGRKVRQAGPRCFLHLPSTSVTQVNDAGNWMKRLFVRGAGRGNGRKQEDFWKVGRKFEGALEWTVDMWTFVSMI